MRIDAWKFYAIEHSGFSDALICQTMLKTQKAESNAAVTSKANAGNFAPFAMKYGGNVETGMARLFLPGKELIYLSKLFQFQVVTFGLSYKLYQVYQIIFVENHWKSKEKVFPLHTDPNMPYEHFMKVKWSWEVVKSGLHRPGTLIA